MPQPTSEDKRQVWKNIRDSIGSSPVTGEVPVSSNVSLAVNEEEGTFTLTVDD